MMIYHLCILYVPSSFWSTFSAKYRLIIYLLAANTDHLMLTVYNVNARPHREKCHDETVLFLETASASR